mmetsp:Transcript_70821/g.188992  ORF Transcript_70821/g.188992 Transcript_70821/m.188992 type:complete len:169 (+) Transcript_70821:1055-1561(+)
MLEKFMGNARPGVELGEFDLLRNLFLQYVVSEEDKMEAYETYWMPMENATGVVDGETLGRLREFLEHFLGTVGIEVIEGGKEDLREIMQGYASQGLYAGYKSWIQTLLAPATTEAEVEALIIGALTKMRDEAKKPRAKAGSPGKPPRPSKKLAAAPPQMVVVEEDEDA